MKVNESVSHFEVVRIFRSEKRTAQQRHCNCEPACAHGPRLLGRTRESIVRSTHHVTLLQCWMPDDAARNPEICGFDLRCPRLFHDVSETKHRRSPSCSDRKSSLASVSAATIYSVAYLDNACRRPRELARYNRLWVPTLISMDLCSILLVGTRASLFECIWSTDW